MYPVYSISYDILIHFIKNYIYCWHFVKIVEESLINVFSYRRQVMFIYIYHIPQFKDKVSLMFNIHIYL